MSLMSIIKFGYALVIFTLILMLWASLSRAREFHVEPGAKHPPCYFNPLCSCSKTSPDLGIVTCLTIPLFRVPPAINSSKVFMLHLENNGLRDLEPYFFKSTGLYRLAINKNPLDEVPEEAFLGLEWSLRELEMHEDGLISVPNKALRYLQKLILLDLTGNEITLVTAESWKGLENSLQTLILSDNSISHLPSNAFSLLPKLVTLDLRGNHLSQIDPSVFRYGMERLTKLILSDNQLPFIPYEELAPLKQLRHLDLAKNLISTVLPMVSLPGIRLSLDVLRLDYNLIESLMPTSFQYFTEVNTTVLDGNPIRFIREDAFRQAKIRSLSLKECGLTEISPVAFQGIENTLQYLDLSANNLTDLPRTIFYQFDSLRFLSLRENEVHNTVPSESLSGFKYALYTLDVSGSRNGITSLQDLRRMRSLRSLSLSKLPRKTLVSDDFQEFGVDLDELRIVGGSLDTIQAHAFRYLRTIKLLDLSENEISKIDKDAFVELGHGLTTFKMSNGLADSVKDLPHDALRQLSYLQHLDISNNKIINVPDTSFHFLNNLKRLELQDNLIEYFPKGTLQGDIHSALESVILSLNRLRYISQHTFVELPALKEVCLEDNLIEKLEKRAFMNLDLLKKISLRGNRLRNITDETFQNLPELEMLDLSYNRLKTFDFSMFDQVGTLGSLIVNASHNRINHLADTIITSYGVNRDIELEFEDEFTLEEGIGIGNRHFNIKSLDLSHNNISYISRSYFRSAEISITHMFLSHNKLQNITQDVFGNMPHLQMLDLSFNRIIEMEFDSFKNTKRLQMLYLSHNMLYDLPSEIFRSLQSLRVVDLSDNDLKILPDNLFSEDRLERLNLENNDLSRIPTNCFSAAAANSLAEMDLSGNSIPAIGNSDLLQKFRSLSWLDLSNNKLVRVDGGSLGSLPRLSWLDLSHNGPLAFGRGDRTFQGLENRLTHLSLKNISLTVVPSLPLPLLRSLDLSNNNLPSVPPDTATNLTQLRYLDLSNNDLTTVPVVTHSLPHLRWISLAGNPITSLTNKSLLGLADRLEHLDISGLRMNVFEMGALAKMQALRSLTITAYTKIRYFNLPKLLAFTNGLKNLWIKVKDDKTNLGIEMLGEFPSKLNNITLSGNSLNNLADNILTGVHHPNLRLALRNTSVSIIQRAIFSRAGRTKNITLDLKHNRLASIANPSTGEWPGIPGKLFLQGIFLEDNPLECDCGIGWIEIWERKRRQYLCSDTIMESCMTSHDDLRISNCINKDNRTLFDVLKNDIECGWNGSTRLIIMNVLYYLALALVVVLYL
ncbi:leucine rich repeat containing G protein-coupled receptor chaoptin [Arctopsyche grandis]|uniref:leucine rich repeat containing G protein-coupled receptor chaoptin n=1 Tax=Arctopsyche grandis TaxID=121162 RepID=UPI00406D85DD